MNDFVSHEKSNKLNFVFYFAIMLSITTLAVSLYSPIEVYSYWGFAVSLLIALSCIGKRPDLITARSDEDLSLPLDIAISLSKILVLCLFTSFIIFYIAANPSEKTLLTEYLLMTPGEERITMFLFSRDVSLSYAILSFFALLGLSVWGKKSSYKITSNMYKVIEVSLLLVLLNAIATVFGFEMKTIFKTLLLSIPALFIIHWEYQGVKLNKRSFIFSVTALLVVAISVITVLTMNLKLKSRVASIDSYAIVNYCKGENIKSPALCWPVSELNKSKLPINPENVTAVRAIKGHYLSVVASLNLFDMSPAKGVNDSERNELYAQFLITAYLNNLRGTIEWIASNGEENIPTFIGENIEVVRNKIYLMEAVKEEPTILLSVWEDRDGDVYKLASSDTVITSIKELLSNEWVYKKEYSFDEIVSAENNKNSMHQKIQRDSDPRFSVRDLEKLMNGV